MVVLKVPLHWDGRLIPGERSIALPPALEHALIDSGNAEPKEPVEIVPPESPPGDSLTPPSASSDSTDESEGESGEDAAANYEPELALGRGGNR